MARRPTSLLGWSKRGAQGLMRVPRTDCGARTADRESTPGKLLLFSPNFIKGIVDSVQQGVLAEGFRQEINRTRPHRLIADFLSTTRRNENDGNWTVLPGQVALQFQAAHSWHSYVKNEAFAFLASFRIQKRFRRRKTFRLEPIRLEETRRGIRDRPVIVDNRDQSTVFFLHEGTIQSLHFICHHTFV